MTRIYLFDRGDEPLPDEAAALLPAWRRALYDRLRRPEARQESLGAGLLYAYVMKMHGVPPETPVERLPAGRPVLSGREDLFFSLSHSGTVAMCGAGPGPVGADVQQMRPVKLTLARRLHPGEQAWLSGLPEGERQTGLFRIWVRKEAWVKAVSRDRLLSLSEADVMGGVPGLWFRDLEMPAGYAAAVCTGEAEIAPPVWVARRDLLAALA